MIPALRPLLALGGALLMAGPAVAQRGVATPLLPSSPHRVLMVSGDAASYYLVEEDKPLVIHCDGPGLLELTLRRAVFPTEASHSASVMVSIDDEVRPPIVFRRVRDKKANFVDETRFFPSAPRYKKVAVPVGTHTVRLEVGQNTPAVAAAIALRSPPTRVADLEPDLVDIPLEEPAAPEPPTPQPVPEPETQPAASSKAPAMPATQPAPAVPPPDMAPATESEVQEIVALPTTPESSPPAADHAQEEVSAGATTPIAGFDAGVGLSTTFINIGRPSPSLRLGGRMLLPWLDQLFSIGLDASVVRYSVYSTPTAATQLEAENWVVPLQVVAAASPRPIDWLHLEVGAGAGVALNFSSLKYGTRESSGFGVGAAGSLYGEAGVWLGPGTLYARAQGDLVSASNAVFRDFNYLGASSALGYRVLF